MTDPLNDHDVRQYLPAFADGELDEARAAEVRGRVDADPRLNVGLTHQHQLRQRVASVFEQQTPGTPAPLRQRIEAMAGDVGEIAGTRGAPPQDAASPAAAASAEARRNAEPGRVAESATVAGRIRRLAMPLAIAAMVVLAAGVLFVYVNGGSPAGALLPFSQVSHFASRHEQCTRALATLMRIEGVGEDVTLAPEALAEKFEQPLLPAPALDLSPIGYEFKGVGHCNAPGANAAHLVYHPSAMGPGDDPAADGLSLWIRRYDGRPDIEADRLYRVVENTPHPIALWRQGNMIYYLVGDSPKTLDQAATVVRTGGR